MVGTDLYHYNPITSFQWTNSGGVPISGAQLIDDMYNRHIQQVDWFLGSASWQRSKYAFVWSADKNAALSLMLNGVKLGAYPFSTNEQFILNTPGAGTSEVYTLGYGGAAPASGLFFFTWSTPVPGNEYQVSQVSVPWNATAAQVVTAIESMQNFQGTVTATGGPLQTADIVITLGGNYANTALFSQGYQLGYTQDALAGAANTVSTPTLGVPTTAGVDGITNNGSYILDLQAYTSAFLKLKTNGALEVAISS